MKPFILMLAITLVAIPPALRAEAQPAEPWTAPARAARKTNPISADEKSIARGKELYVKGCAPCHGSKGKGDGPASVTLNPKPADHTSRKMWEESDGSLFWKITTGRGAMPSWEESYSEEDRWHIINFLRTLAPPKASPSQQSKQGDKP
jgi:mono/diheme cytochrome c family protein